MADIWFISDTHFGHRNILTFKEEDGRPVRGQFSTVEEMNEHMINEWNKLVKPQDKVYHLGDVGFGSFINDGILYRLTGKKRLVLGNHDDRYLKNNEFTKHFDKIMLWRVFKGFDFICTHVPLREDQFRDGCTFNVHGHIHTRPLASKNHAAVCVELTDYRPLHLDEVMQKIKETRQ